MPGRGVRGQPSARLPHHPVLRPPQPRRVQRPAQLVAGQFRHDDLVVRVDGDVAEIFCRGAFSHRVLLAWLAVQVQPSIKGRLVVRITSASANLPLYEVQAKARPVLGSTVEVVIKTEEEPLYRQFFTRVGQLCGRIVVP
jgi:hypothetical protein